MHLKEHSAWLIIAKEKQKLQVQNWMPKRKTTSVAFKSEIAKRSKWIQFVVPLLNTGMALGLQWGRKHQE